MDSETARRHRRPGPGRDGGEVSKTERIALRDATYTEPELPERRCETCEYFQWDNDECELVDKVVKVYATCEAWEKS